MEGRRKAVHDKDGILEAIRQVAQNIGHSPSRAEFVAGSGINEYHILKWFDSWRDAVQAAGFQPHTANIRLRDEDLLEDWGSIVRTRRHIPTRDRYRKEGRYSADVFDKHFGPWTTVPKKFREFAKDKPQWSDVLALLPLNELTVARSTARQSPVSVSNVHAIDSSCAASSARQYSQLQNRPTYGNPIDFRGLRHEPVNEDGVIFLFGMVARELGYLVEAVQTGFPDCDAKRQIGPGKWQRVRIEFEFESRNFRDHGHSPEGCDVIVCWHHNWSDCPSHLEVVDLSNEIKSLAKSDE